MSETLEPNVTAVTNEFTNEELELLSFTKTGRETWRKPFNDEGESLSSKYGHVSLRNINSIVASYALLAAVDHSASLCLSENSDAEKVILKAVLRSGFVNLALKIINIGTDIDSLDKTAHFLHRRDFNRKIHVSTIESLAQLRYTNLWVLCKHLDNQINWAINVCFPKKFNNLPLCPVESIELFEQTYDNFRTVEDAYRKEKGTPEDILLCYGLENISSEYNRILQSAPDFSEAYAEAESIRKNQNVPAQVKISSGAQIVRGYIEPSIPEKSAWEKPLFEPTRVFVDVIATPSVDHDKPKRRYQSNRSNQFNKSDKSNQLNRSNRPNESNQLSRPSGSNRSDKSSQKRHYQKKPDNNQAPTNSRVKISQSN